MHRGSGNQIASFCGQVVFRFAGKGNQLGRDDYFDRDSRSDCDRQDYAAGHVQGLQNACGLDCGRVRNFGSSSFKVRHFTAGCRPAGNGDACHRHDSWGGLLKGVAAGPVIASGMAYVIISLLGLSFK